MVIPWPIYFLVHFLRFYLKKEKRPILAGFKITHKCNLKCIHCPYWKKGINEQMLSYPKAIEVLKKMHDLGARILIIEGGEPFLWHDGNYTIKDIIKTASRYFYSVGITTNGTFPIIDIPANVVWVSFDGLKENFTKIRGNCFDKVMENIKNSNHPNLYVNITINSINVDEIPDLIKFISKWVKGITIQFHYPYDGYDELTLDFKKRRWVLNKIITLKKEGFPISDSYGALISLKDNSWRCHDWLLVNAEPDGTINQGCYLKNRGKVNCALCGFAAHTELSRAFDMHISSILVGRKVFKYH
ncbi:MAG: radical SAM protein [Deltaproteobacteria bacterium]|nr:radical SAM protein [Deltaproteobacteria bacterium]